MIAVRLEVGDLVAGCAQLRDQQAWLRDRNDAVVLSAVNRDDAWRRL